MDVLPPNNDDPFNMTTMLRALDCAVIGMIGASFSSLDRKVKGLEMYWHMCLALVFTGLFFTSAVAMWPNIHWLVWPLPCFVLGFSVYGIAVALRRGDKTVGDTDIISIIKRRTGFDDKKE